MGRLEDGLVAVNVRLDDLAEDVRLRSRQVH